MKKLSVVLLSIVSSALLITGGSALAYSQPSGMRSKVVSPRKMQARQLKALVLLAAFQFLIVFAGFFAPYGFAAQDRERPFAPPTALHFRDAQGHFHLRPFANYVWQAIWYYQDR